MHTGTTVAETLVRVVRALPPSRATNRLGRLLSIGLGAAGVNVIAPVALLDGTQMLLDLRGRTESEAIWTGKYDEGLMAFLRAAAAVAGPNFIDVGANVGLIALPMARVSGRVLAVEPVPENADALQASLALNGLTNIHLVRCAAGAEPGEVTLTREGRFGQTRGNAVIDTEASSVVMGGIRTNAVPVRTLDDIASEAGGRWHVIKIDCEGFDVNVVKGARVLLMEQRPILWGEFHGDYNKLFGLGFGQLAQLLTEARYRVFVFEDVFRVHEVAPVDGVGNAALVPTELVEPLLAELQRTGLHCRFPRRSPRGHG